MYSGLNITETFSSSTERAREAAEAAVWDAVTSSRSEMPYARDLSTRLSR